MSEPHRAPRRGRLPLGLFGMLVLVAAAEGYVDRHGQEFTTVWASAWSRSGKAARREAPRCDVLCFGDSLVMHGVAPRVFEDRLGRPAYNLAVFNGQAPTSYFLLRRALKAGARPSAVLIDGEVLESDPRTHARLWADLASAAECLELARSAHDASFFASIALARVVPSIKARFEIRARMLKALGGTSDTTLDELVLHRRNGKSNRGAQILPSAPSPPQLLLDQLAQSNYYPASWNCDPLNALYVKKFLKLAESRQIPVYWLLPPIHPEVQARREQGGRDGLYVGFVRRLQARFPNLTVIDGRHANYHPSAMWDLTHLNRRGTYAFSADLATILDSGPSPPSHWIELPAYRERPIDAPVEDLEQSRVALREAGAARRR